MPAYLSLITPLYNKGRYILETAESVLTQTYPDWEWVVVDNNSTDAGPQQLQALRDPRLRVLSQSQHQGPAATRNAGLEVAQGKWVLFLDADDLLEPDYLAQLVVAAEQAPEATLVAGGWKQFRKTPGEKGEIHRPAGKEGRSELTDLAIGFAPWAIHAAMIRRDCCPSWPEALDGLVAEDIVFWFRAIQGQRIHFVDAVGALYRVGTPGGRTCRDQKPQWFAGVDAAIRLNVEEWQRRGLEPTPGQCMTLVQVYARLYEEARAGKDSEVAQRALSRAQYWLEQRWARGGSRPPGIWLRKWMGLSAYQRMIGWSRAEKGGGR